MNAEWRIKGIYKADANKVAMEIGDKPTTPEQVLEKARNENTELHKCFEWNNDIAAEKYRLEQARKIIINLVHVKKKEDEHPVRCFSISTEKSVYKPTIQFLVQEDEYQALLKRARAELESFKRKYATLTELEEVFKAIDTI